MWAVILDHYDMILFSPGEIPSRLRGEIIDGLGGEIRDGVTLVVPPDVQGWPSGTKTPEASLGVSRSDSSYYEVLKDRDQAGSRDLDVVEKSFGVIGSEDAWETFVESLRTLNAIADRTGGVEPPDTPEGEGR